MCHLNCKGPYFTLGRACMEPRTDPRSLSTDPDIPVAPVAPVVPALFYLTEQTATAEGQGRRLRYIFCKAVDICSPLWGPEASFRDVTTPSLQLHREVTLSALEGCFPTHPQGVSCSCGAASTCVCEEMSRLLVLSSKRPEATLGHARATSHMCRWSHFPRIPEQDWGPQRCCPSEAIVAHQNV